MNNQLLTQAMSTQPPLVFIIGGTGAQGMPVVKALVEDEAYRVRLLTRDANSRRAKELKAIKPSHVEFTLGTFFSEDDMRAGFRGADFAFVNIDGFNSGEQAELYWTIRSYEIALEEGIKFYVHGNLDYAYKLGGYKPELRTGHFDGKGKAGIWILNETKENGKKMGAASFSTGPYVDLLISKYTPMAPKIEDGVVTWRVPLANGSISLVDLEDCGYYVRWLLDNQEHANGTDLKVAVEMVDFTDMAAAFTKVTGKPAQYIPISFEEYWKDGPLAANANRSAGYSVKADDPARVTVQKNFTGFWHIWMASPKDGSGVIKRDFKLLDEIFPNRVKSMEEWFKKEEARGIASGVGSLWDRVNNLQTILKIHEDNKRVTADVTADATTR
jgi:hypothetical protein